MKIHLFMLLILSTVFVQLHGMNGDGTLAAEDMEPGMWERCTNYCGQWFTNAQYDDEDIKGGVPGIRYLMHFHGGKCMLVCAVVIGGYLVYRNYKHKQETKQREEQAIAEEQTQKSPITDYIKEAYDALRRVMFWNKYSQN